MAAQPGISTSAAPPNAVVQIQPGMNVQPVVLVDQNGQYISGGIPEGAASATWFATDHGLACNDTTDDTSALNALLTTVTAAGGGTIIFPSLSLISGQISIPSALSGNQLRQAPVRLAGTMPNRPGQSEAGTVFPSGGLDLRYAGRTDTGCGTTAGSNIVTDASAVAGDYGQIIISPGNLPDRTYIMAVTPGVGYSLNNGARVTNASASFTIGGGKIFATGLGTLELDHLLLCDQGTSSTPFVLATGTTVDMHDCAVVGNAAKSSGTCDQDVFVGGGPGHGTALTSALTASSNYTSLAVSALPVALLTGTIVITDGTDTQTVTNSAAAAGATSITVTSFTANANYAIGSAVLFGGYQAATGASYLQPCANFQGYGTHLHDCFFNRVRRVLLQDWVSDVYIDTCIWWQNCGSNLAVTASTLTSAVNVAGSPYTTLAVTALPAAVAAGDQIQLGTNSPGSVTPVISQVATASAPAAAGATSISINSFTATGTYAIGVKAINTTAGIGAALEVYGTTGNVSLVNATSNRFEMSGAYSYAVRLCGPAAYESSLIANNLQDSNAANIAAYRFDAGAQFNTLIPGLVNNNAVPLLDDQSATAGSQIVLRPQQSQPSLFPQGIITQGLLSQYTDGYEPALTDSSGGVYQARGTGGSYFVRYTPSGGTLTDLLRLTYGSATSVTWTTESSITTLVIAGQGTASLRAAAGSALNLGDPTRQTDVIVQNGNLSVVHLLSQAGSGGAAPAVAAASSSTGLSITGTDTAHNVQLTTAASIGAGSSVATITFNLSYATRAPSKTPRITVTPKNQASAAAQPYITGDGQTAYAIALANPPAGATAMAFDVLIIAS